MSSGMTGQTPCLTSRWDQTAQPKQNVDARQQSGVGNAARPGYSLGAAADPNSTLSARQPAKATSGAQGGSPAPQGGVEMAAAMAAKINAMLMAKGKLLTPPPLLAKTPVKVPVSTTTEETVVTEVDINDVPINCRDLLTKGKTQEEIRQFSGAVVSTKGHYMTDLEKGKGVERPLYLHVQGKNQDQVNKAVMRIKEIISEDVLRASAASGGQQIPVMPPLTLYPQPPRPAVPPATPRMTSLSSNQGHRPAAPHSGVLIILKWVALSRGHGKFFFRGNVTVEEGLHDLEHPDVALADEWTYCNTDEHPEHRYLSQIEAIKLYLSGHRPHLQCDKELIQEVLFDAVVTAPLEAYWTSLVLNKSENSDKGVEIAYLGTRTGLSRINLFVVPDELTNQDFLTAEDKEGVFNADHFPLWYKRAAEQVPGTFVYSLPFNTGSENKSVVLASTAIQLLDERKSPIAAAVGIQMKLEFFQRKFWTASRQCAALDGKCSINCDDENINCYLIDNNGFVLVAEDYTLTGKFFGEAEGAVMNKLLQMGSFKRVTLYDYQAICWIYSESSDSGHTLLDPYFAFLAAMKWIVTELVIFLVEFNLYSWWSSDLTAKAQRMGRTMQVPCDTEYPAFISERTIKENTGNIDCDGCIKSFVIQQIPSSNLFMVVVDNKCDCSMIEPITMDPIEIMYNESLKCERLKFQKDRKRPDTCHPFHPEENSMECGGVSGLTPSLASTLLCLLLALLPR